jgi:hypothetical protein
LNITRTKREFSTPGLCNVSDSIYTMSDTTLSSSTMSLKQFAAKEYRGAPLLDRMDVRYPRRLATWVKTHALTHNVTDSTVLRYAVEQYAKENGFDSGR